MHVAQLSIMDRFVEFGNLFFNIKDEGKEFKYDLYYESTSQDPVNRFMINNEEKISKIFKYFISIVDFLQFLISRNSHTKMEIKDNNKLYIQKNMNIKNLSSQQVIQRNVRNRLLKTISIDDSKQESAKKDNYFSKIFNLRISLLHKDKKQDIVKNRYMG